MSNRHDIETGKRSADSNGNGNGNGNGRHQYTETKTPRLVWLLLSNRRMSRSDIMNELGLSERSVYRHIGCIRRAGFGVEYDGAYRIDLALGPDFSDFTPSELDAIDRIVTELCRDKKQLRDMTACSAIHKLIGTIADHRDRFAVTRR